LLHKKEWNQSIEYSQAALALNKDDAVAHANLGEAYLGLGRLADARTQWQKLLTMNDERTKAEAQKYLDKYPQ
jgi:tetratricopeptide (TPR) repeat protein